MQVFEGHQQGPPGGKLSDLILHLSSDVLEALGDGWLAGCTADTHDRREELLHAWHLSGYGPQMVEG